MRKLGKIKIPDYNYNYPIWDIMKDFLKDVSLDKIENKFKYQIFYCQSDLFEELSDEEEIPFYDVTFNTIDGTNYTRTYSRLK